MNERQPPEEYVSSADSPFVWAKRKVDSLCHTGYTAEWNGAMSKAHSDGMENICKEFLDEFATGYEHREETCESCAACDEILEEMDMMLEEGDEA